MKFQNMEQYIVHKLPRHFNHKYIFTLSGWGSWAATWWPAVAHILISEDDEKQKAEVAGSAENGSAVQCM